MQRATKASRLNSDSEMGFSYSTLPVNGNPSGSPGGGSSERRNFPKVLPQTFNSKQPYEQLLVAQLFEAYRKERNQPLRQRLYERHSHK